jgi:FAD/FMN-containing dehydrogenase
MYAQLCLNTRLNVSLFSGASQIVLKPKTTEQVSAILKYCNAENLAVCPQGGNTGLVGGSVPVFDEVVISTSLMNNIISLDELSGTSHLCYDCHMLHCT